MTKQTPLIDINDPELRSGLIAGFGAGVMFVIQRFFKNKDSYNDRLRKLENQHIRIEGEIKSILRVIDNVSEKLNSVSFNIEDKDGYVHKSHHKLANLVNEKMLKDNFVEDLEGKVDLILEKLEKDEKD